MVCSKLHKDLGESTLLPLGLCKTKFTKHSHIFYFDNTQLSGIKLTGNGPNGNTTPTISMFQKKFNVFRTAQIH